MVATMILKNIDKKKDLQFFVALLGLLFSLLARNVCLMEFIINI